MKIDRNQPRRRQPKARIEPASTSDGAVEISTTPFHEAIKAAGAWAQAAAELWREGQPQSARSAILDAYRALASAGEELASLDYQICEAPQLDRGQRGAPRVDGDGGQGARWVSLVHERAGHRVAVRGRAAPDHGIGPLDGQTGTGRTAGKSRIAAGSQSLAQPRVRRVDGSASGPEAGPPAGP